MTTAPAAELDGLFQHELRAVNDDVRRKAALSAFQKLRPGSGVSIDQFLTGLQRHQELWAVVGTLGIVDFAEMLLGNKRAPSAGPSSAAPRKSRTRVSDAQKTSLKSAILWVLESHEEGMSRTELAETVIAAGLRPNGIERDDVPEKIRQPLHELIAEGKLHTVGQKRLMRYMFGAKKGK